MIKKEAITGYKNLEIDIYQDIGLEQKKDLWYKSCLNDLSWETGFIKIFGKTHQIPRLQAWYAEDGVEYTYSGKKLQRHNWNKTLIDIKEEIESITSFKFNSVLANLYRNGDDSMGLHSDDEKELGQNPVIGSVSLGAQRKFKLRHKQFKENGLKHDILLQNGSFLLMHGATQHHWMHEIPRTALPIEPRVNLTFRVIRES